MFLSELHVDNFLKVQGVFNINSKYSFMIYEAGFKATVIDLKLYNPEGEHGGFWLNPFLGKAVYGNVAHVEMIRQYPGVFGLDDEGMPIGNTDDVMGDPEYEDWLDKNDPNTSKMKLGVFYDGWVRGAYEYREIVNITGIPLAIKRLYPNILLLVSEYYPKQIIIETFDKVDNVKKHVFNMPEQYNEFISFFEG